MAAVHQLKGSNTAPAMATQWRRRRMCLLVADTPVPAALRDISGSGAFLETNARPALQSMVRFHHPDAGFIDARVDGIANDGIRIAFSGDSASVAFALTAITADMTQS
jgi:PilZ domain.